MFLKKACPDFDPIGTRANVVSIPLESEKPAAAQGQGRCVLPFINW
jgi:hypothetical protein